MSLPNTYTEKNETGCCPVPNISQWDKKENTFKDRYFIRGYSRSFMYVPLNYGGTLKKLDKAAEDANAKLPTNQAMMLSHDLSPWKAEQLYSVTKPLEGADNVTLSGDYISMVFDGPYSDAKKWYEKTIEYVKSKGKEASEVYFFYTTCPKCAKHYGRNYTYVLAKV